MFQDWGAGFAVLLPSLLGFFFFFTSPLPLSSLFCTDSVPLLFPSSLGKVLGPYMP